MFRAYYLLTKPGIVYSNVMTAAAGYLLASVWHIQVWQCAGLLVGTGLVIASACVCNNYIDRAIDQKMARTRKRALAAGTIRPAQAFGFALLLAAGGFGALLLTNWFVEALGIGAFISYVILYGFAKRRTKHGTLVGTLPGAASLVAGYIAVTGTFDLIAALLFAVMVVWQMPHFYAIAMRRIDDYRAAGLPVWPVKEGMLSTKRFIMFYVVLFLITNTVLAVYGHLGIIYLVGIDGIAGYWLLRGTKGLEAADDRTWAGGMFGLSLLVLLSLSAGLAVGRLLV